MEKVVGGVGCHPRMVPACNHPAQAACCPLLWKELQPTVTVCYRRGRIQREASRTCRRQVMTKSSGKPQGDA
jgi:hypothetical protein